MIGVPDNGMVSGLFGGVVVLFCNIVFDWLKGKNKGGPCSEHSGVLTHITLLHNDVSEIKEDVKCLLRKISSR